MEPHNVTKLFNVPVKVDYVEKIRIIKEYVYVKCDCKRRKTYEITIMDLPRVIMVEILSRLPIKPVFRCKSVCKRWYNLFSDPLFVKMYRERSSFPCILLCVSQTIASILELKADYDYYSHPPNRPIMLSPKFHFPPLKSKSYRFRPELLIGSCKGFICLLSGDTYDDDHSVYISNPLLGEYFKVKLPEWEKRVRRVAYAFCFGESSGRYKVLRSVTRKFRGRPEVSELEVYTLGVDEKWRNVGGAPYPLCGSFGNVNVNGVLHWLDDDETTKKGEAPASIYSFNIETEEVKPLPAPPGLETPSLGLTLAELENCLCLSDNGYSEYVDIWWMKEYGIVESWTKDRILTDSISHDMHYDIFIPIIIWKDGEILMQSDRGTQLVSYNPKEKKFRKVDVYRSGNAATRYIPSFYSLKTVMGESFQVSNAYPKNEASKKTP